MIPICMSRPCGIVANILYVIRIPATPSRARIASARVHGQAHLSERESLSRADRRGRPLAAGRHHRRAETQGARGGLVELIPPGQGVRRRPLELRVRATVRNHGPVSARARGFQLLRTGYRQHGSAGALWERRAETTLAETSARG